MSRLPALLSSSVVVALLSIPSLYAPRATACSPDIAVVLLSGPTEPSTGDTDVPTNARVFFSASSGDFSGVTATVQRGDDQPVSANVEAVPGGLVVADIALEPRTTYTARIEIPDPFAGSTDENDVADPALQAEVVFTTGDVDDDTPPAWDGEAEIVTEHEPGNGLFGQFTALSCGPEPASDLHTITPPDVDGDIAVVELRLAGPDGSVVVAAGAAGEPLSHRVVGATSVRYELVAIDVAGNESEPLVVEAAGTGGCSATNASDAGAAAIVTVALTLLRRRRRAC
jgi:hypothetical protein